MTMLLFIAWVKAQAITNASRFRKYAINGDKVSLLAFVDLMIRRASEVAEGEKVRSPRPNNPKGKTERRTWRKVTVEYDTFLSVRTKQNNVLYMEIQVCLGNPLRFTSHLVTDSFG